MHLALSPEPGRWTSANLKLLQIMFYAQCGTQLDIFWTTSKALLWMTECLPPYIQTDLGYFQGSFNCLTDVYLTVLPGILIEHSRLSLKRKISVALLLCLSVLALVAAIVKTYEAKALSEVMDYTCECLHEALSLYLSRV